MLTGLLRHLEYSRDLACPEARYNALLYARSRELPLLAEVASTEATGGAVDAEMAAVDDEFTLLVNAGKRLVVGRFVVVNAEGFITKVTVREACRTDAHQWLPHKDELGYTPEDFALCAVSHFEIGVELMTPVPRPKACAAVVFQSQLIDRIALLTKAVVFDIDASRFTSPVRRRIADALWPVDIREHVGFQCTRRKDGVRVRTRGMVKFGCPDLEAAQIPVQSETIQLVTAALADLAQQIALGNELEPADAMSSSRIGAGVAYVS